MNISSDKLMDAMLAHQLDGNEMKIIIAYVRLGGWKHGVEVFLPEAKRIEWGISRATAKRVRKSLREKGWLKMSQGKSRFGCDMYTVHIPPMPKVAQNEPGRWLKNDPEVAQNEPLGGSNPPLEVTKEVPKEVTKRSNEAPSARSATASPSLSLLSNKDDLHESSPIPPVAPASPIEPKDSEVAQIEPGHSVTQNDEDYYEWHGMKIRKAGTGDPFAGATAPVEPKVKTPCPRCGVPMDSAYCWEMNCVSV